MSKLHHTLCVILARAGSKGLPGKNAMPIAGMPMLAWTIEHAQAAKQRGVIDHIVVSTDGDQLADIARAWGVPVIRRPDELANDTATVDAAARHAVAQIVDLKSQISNVVILYGNVPVRPNDLIDQAVGKLITTGCDSVQSVAAVGKMHPYWMKTLGGESGDVLLPYVANQVYRRQDLPGVYMLDGGIIAVTRASLFIERAGEPHAFLGEDRRAIVTEAGGVMDVDDASDAALAEQVLSRAVANARLVIGDRVIGRDSPVYVIAEIGVNHDGQVARAIELTHAAKQAGADAVKLQLFDPDMLLSNQAMLADYQRPSARDPHAMLRALQLSIAEMQQVRQAAHDLGIDFIVTPFSLEHVQAMRALVPDAVKIASPDCVNHPLLLAMAALGLPMIVSTGTCTTAEIAAASRSLGDRAVALLHCVSAYPVPIGAADLSGISRAERHRVWGYSDHTTSPLTGALATACGARIIEKHLTYDTQAAGPDHAASFNPAQFTEYVRLIREAESQLQSPAGDVQHDVKKVSRQSICAVRAMVAGHVIERGDVTVKRPGTGIAAAQLPQVIGCKVLRDVNANDLLQQGDIDLG